MSIDINTVVTFTRQNTGKHFLDSGDAYGRIWQSPAPGDLFSVARDGEVSLTLTGLLAQHATMVVEVQEALDAALAADERLTWFDAGPQVMESLGYEQAARDNTYNGESDMDQVFVWEVWQHEGSRDREWIYDDEAIVLVYAHTGCDVRGGYARPIAVRFDGEYALPVDLVLSFHPANAATEEWMHRTRHDTDVFSAGYSSNPQYRLREAVGAFVSHDPESQTLTFENPSASEDDSKEPQTLTFGYSFDGCC